MTNPFAKYATETSPTPVEKSAGVNPFQQYVDAPQEVKPPIQPEPIDAPVMQEPEQVVEPEPIAGAPKQPKPAISYTQEYDGVNLTSQEVTAEILPPFIKQVYQLFGRNGIGKMTPEQQDKWVKKEDARSAKRLAATQAAFDKSNIPLTEWVEKNSNISIKGAKPDGALLKRMAALRKKDIDFHTKELEKTTKRRKSIDDIIAGRKKMVEYNAVKSAGANAIKNFMSFGSSTLKSAGAIQATFTGQNPEDTGLHKSGRVADAITEQVVYPDPARSHQTADQVAGGLGQAGSMILGGKGLGAIGAGPKATSAGMSAMGAVQGGAGGLDDALRFDADRSQQLKSFYFNAGLGTTEAIPLSRMFSRLEKASGGKVSRVLANTTAQTLEEATQEVVQTLGANYVAKELAGYDEGRKIMAGVKNAATIGGIVGGILGGGGAMVTRSPDTAPEPTSGQQIASTIEGAYKDAGETVKNDNMEPIEPIRAKVFKKANAYDAAGGQTKVRYAIVDADSLITSHTDDLGENPLYPQALQPRDRSRKSSETQIADIAAKLNPEQMGETSDAGSGAPIISANGIVESGNGRSLALRRVYAEDGPKAKEYRKWLKSQRYPIRGIAKPVLVRIANPERSDAERVDFTRRANAAVTADMSVTERGIADARSLTPADFDLASSGGADTLSNVPFVRAVLSKTTTEAERGKLVDAKGNLSVDGKRRVEAAVAAYAYEDPRVVSNLLETTDKTLRSIGDVMIGVAPQWAKLRADVESGTVDERVNIIPNIIEAAQIVTDARNSGATLDQRTDMIKSDMFNESGDIDPVTQDVLKMFYDADSINQRSDKLIADDLKYYAQEAGKVLSGPDIFGDRADDNPAQRILQKITERRADIKQTTKTDDFEPAVEREAVFKPEPETQPEAETQERDPNTSEMFDKAKKYPIAPRGEWYGEANYKTAGGKMIEMSPDEYIDRVRPLKIDEESRENIDILKEHILSGKTLDPLKLYDGGKEDGRHRAYAAKELGIDSVPVIAFGDQITEAPLFDKAPATESAAFKRWFGDSKVVDERGDPLVVYHGTDTQIDAFKSSEIGKADNGYYGQGFYFTPNYGYAKDYAYEAVERKEIEGISEGEIIPVYTSIKKPFMWEAFDDDSAQDTSDALKLLGVDIDPDDLIDQITINDTDIDGRDFSLSLTDNGYDGLIVVRMDQDGKPEVSEVMALQPNQIKSVENKGKFDPNDDRILYDKAPGKASVKTQSNVSRAANPFSKYDTLKDDVGNQPEKPTPKPSAPIQKSRGVQERRPSATPAGETIGSANERAVGLHKITMAVRKRFEAIARQGRMGGARKEVRGFYKPNSGVIRTRKSYMGEINTFVHEVGHHFEFTQDKAFRRLLERHDQELIPMDYMPGRKDRPLAISEGFAEFFKSYMLNPAHAEKNAPRFKAAFSSYLDSDHKGLRADIQAFSDQYSNWLTAPSATSVASNIVPHGKKLSPIAKAKDQGVKSYASEILNKTIENTVDRLHPMKIATARLESLYRKNKGKPLNNLAANDPYKILRLAENASSKGVMDMFDGVAPYRSAEHEGASLQDAILTAVGSKSKWTQELVTDFDAYLVARRAVQEYKRYAKGEIKNAPTINSLADHETAIKDFEKANPQFQAAADKVYEYTQNLWKKKYDAGLITEEVYELTTARADYVPFKRDMTDKATSAKFAAGFKDNGKHSGGSHHFDGSNRPILSPLQSIMEDSISSARIIARNDSVKALVSMAKKAGRGSAAIVEILPAKSIQGTQVDAIQAVENRLKDSNLSYDDQQLLLQEISDMWDGDGLTTIFKNVEVSDKGENIMYVWDEGKRTPLLIHDPELSNDLYSMMLGLNDEAKNLIVDIAAVPTTVLRMGITNHPMFIATNFVRDQLSTWVQSDAGFMPFVDGFRGVVAEVTNNKYARAYNTMGGVSGGVNVSAFKKNLIEKDLNRLRGRGIQVRKLWRLSEMSKLGDISESATRLGVFTKYVKKYKKQGMTDYEAFAEAAFESTDIMDFGMHGAQMGSARRLVPFLNAQIQGLYKTGRVLAPGGLFATVKPYIKYKMGDQSQDLSKSEIRNVERGARAWAKIAAIGAFGLALSAIHEDDEEYLEFNEYYRATHWITKVNGEWVLIPKPFELAAMSNLFERSYEAFKLKDETAFKKFRKGMAGMLKPPTSIPGFSLITEQVLNKTFFTKGPIVPRGTEGPLRYAQYSAGTSIASRKIGEALNWSPARVDHAVKGLGGTMGRDLLRVTDAVSGKKPSLSPSNTPIISRLVKDPNYSANSRNEIFKLVGDTGGHWTNKSTRLKKDIARGNEPAARKAASFIKDEDERIYVMVHALKDGKMKVDLKRSHPMRRAKDASELLRAARKEISQFQTYGDIKLSRDQARDLSTHLARLDTVMSRNGLKYSNVKGYKQKSHSPEAPSMDKIQGVSPEFYKALFTSKAWRKVGNEEGIVSRYDKLKRLMTPEVLEQALKDTAENK